ncbi:MAG: HYR domain-containing protein [Cyclobacteriaceae bacterium]
MKLLFIFAWFNCVSTQLYAKSYASSTPKSQNANVYAEDRPVENKNKNQEYSPESTSRTSSDKINNGPGGIGTAVENLIWLSADKSVFSNNTQLAGNDETVFRWEDISGNGRHATATVSVSRPVLKTNIFNGRNAIYFNGTNKRMTISSALLSNVFSNEFTIAIIYANDDPGNTGTEALLSKGKLDSKILPPYDESALHIQTQNNYASANINSLLLRESLSVKSQNENKASYIGMHLKSGDKFYLNSLIENKQSLSISSLGSIENAKSLHIGAADNGSVYTNFFKGHIAEIIVYNRFLNAAESIILENSLAAKYDLPIGTKRYAYAATHGHDVTGIGAIDGTSHRDAKGPALVRIYEPSSLSNGDFLLIGHNNGKLQNGCNDLRNWRADVHGNPGTVSLTFDLKNFTYTTQDKITLYVGSNSNFSTPIIYQPTGVIENDLVTFKNVILKKGDFFTLNLSMDLQAPVINNCPANIRRATDAGKNTAVVSWFPPTATDNCGTPQLTTSYAPGQAVLVGTQPVTYTATDNFGNQATCQFTITVVDEEAPVISNMPSNRVLPSITGQNYANVSWTPPTITDNVFVKSKNATAQPGAKFTIGAHTVTYTASDSSGNSANASFNIEIKDYENPVIHCPKDTLINTSMESDGVVFTYAIPSATDNSGSVTVTQTDNSGLSSGSVFPEGNTTLSYRATDPSGNTANCSFTVRVVKITNRFPLAVDDYYETDEDVPLTANVLDNDSDPDGDNISVNINNTTQPKNGQLSIQPNGNFTYTPNENYYGTDEFAYQICDDASPSLCAIAIVRITIHPVNDPPEILVTQFEIIPDVANEICLDVFDVEGDAVYINSIIESPKYGTIELLADASDLCFVYQPEIRFRGRDSMIIEVCDENEFPECTQAKLQLNIQGGSAIVPYKAFSPNGDGLNDTWVIPGIEQFPNNKVRILNRWGSVVYDVKGYDNNRIVWDGATEISVTGSNGLSNGTYFYIIDPGEGEAAITGYLELIR